MSKVSVRYVWTAAVLAVLMCGIGGAQVKSVEEIVFPRLPDFDIPRPEVYSLGNGMKVFLLEDRELPLINVVTRIRTGSDYEPGAKTGLARLTGTVLRTGGTATTSGDEINELLEARAASVESSMGRTSGFLSMNCLKEDFDPVIEVFGDILRSPQFAEDKLELAKVQARTNIARRNDSLGGMAAREFNRLVYGPDSPLVAQEEYQTIAAIDRQDLVAWHGRFYHPNNVYLGVSGDFDRREVKDKIAAVFGDWKAGPAFDASPSPYRKNQAKGVYFVEKSDVNQANVQLGHLGITYDNPDFFAVQVMNEVLGGGFTSRLFSQVRTDKGLAYNVYGSVGASFLQPGLTRIGLQTKSSTMAEAVDALYEEMRGMITRPPTEDEIQRSKESILNSFIFNYASKQQVLGQLMLYSYYGLPADFLERYRDRIDKVTQKDVERVAKAYLHPDQATLLVVGSSADFDRPVDSFGTVTEVDITIPPPPDTTPKVEKTAAGLEAGRQALARVARVLGGEAAAETRAIQTQATQVLSLQGQSISIRQTALTVFPDKQRVVMATPMGEQTVVVTGEGGFLSAGGQVQVLPGDRAKEQLKELARELSYLVRYADHPELEAVAGEREEVEGAECQILALSFQGGESRLWVAQDGTVRKQAYQGQHPLTRAPAQVEIFYSDYRQVAGWRLPFGQRMEVDGEELVTATVESIEIDPEVDLTLFEKPAG